MPEKYIAQKNDCMASIAAKFGFGDYKLIYDDALNADLKTKRPNPNLLCAGDKVMIPDRQLKEESCATDQKHVFELKRQKTKLRIQLKDDKDQFLADKKYELKLGDLLIEDSTDGQGFIEQEIDPRLTSGKLKVFTGDEKLKVLVWDIAIGQLEPPDTDRGVQHRLKNLGYYFGPLNGNIDDKTQSSVEAYKGDSGMTKDKTVDDPLKNTLRDDHDKKG
jgi:hypothetical protein